MTDSRRADTLIVGAGTSGAVLAARLSRDPARRVLVIEAGPLHLNGFSSDLLDPRIVPGARARPETAPFPATLVPGRDHVVLRGRGLGGSSTVNGGYFIRARAADFDLWAESGGPAWSYAAVLPVLRGLERDIDFGESAVHGGSGPVPVRRPPQDGPVAEALFAAAGRIGLPIEADKNDEGRPGVGAVPLNSSSGIRWNTGMTHLLPAAGRENLAMRENTSVIDLVVAKGSVQGVRTSNDEVFLADETVLCAGAFGTAELLLRSGIGPGPTAHRARPCGAGRSTGRPGVLRSSATRARVAPAGARLHARRHRMVVDRGTHRG